MIARGTQAKVQRGLALAIAIAASFSACQTTPGTIGGAPMCTYGEPIACGPENRCTSTCLPDLSAYGPCVCGNAGTDAGDGGKRDSG